MWGIRSSIYRKFRSTRGSALLVAVILTAIMAVATAYAAQSVLFQNRLSVRSEDYLSSLALAEAGAERAMRELNPPTDPDTGSMLITQWAGWASSGNQRTFTESITDHSGAVKGEVSITVNDVGTETPSITSTGFIPDRENPVVRRSIFIEGQSNSETIPTFSPSPFGGFGIYSRSTITLNGGNGVDSYDSLQDCDGDGTDDFVGYNSNNSCGALNRGNSGNMGANNGGSSSGNAIIMNGNNSVGGSLQARGGILRNPVNGNPVTGQVIPNSAPTAPPTFPTADYTAAVSNNNNSTGISFTKANGNALSVGDQASYNSSTKKITLNGSNLRVVFKPGTYYLTQFTANGSGHRIDVYPAGVVKLYMNGDFTANGSNNGINADPTGVPGDGNDTGGASPTRFQLFSYSGDVTVNGGANGAHMGILTRTNSQDVTLNGGNGFFGVAVGGRVTANGNIDLHLDQALLEPTQTGSTTTFSGLFARSWTELKPQE